MQITEKVFGETPEGETIFEYILENGQLKLKIINYGAILVELHTPDRNGKLEDIILGFDSLDGYINDDTYQGATIGRFANRIKDGCFKIDDKEYKLAQNDGENHLHGGIKAFNKVIWKAEKIEKEDSIGLELSYFSKDGEENYPGNLKSTVIYLIQDNTLNIYFKAFTDKTTPVNMSHHSYFNLNSAKNGNILDHKIKINANQYLPVNKNLIPTGAIKSVQDTAMDFTELTRIRKQIKNMSGGYDHNWVLNKNNCELRLAAEVVATKSGRKMELSTTKPGLQFYSGNFLDGTMTGKYNIQYNKHQGLCLEPQFFPDSPNHPEFPFSFLRPNEIYEHSIRYRFSTI
ncbi:MAG: galactose mutarotase [Candidatus Marinimicrobia bacterium]|nr:galactose mutarotase [Candidatus Neomarinimicrobiota bacterium]